MNERKAGVILSYLSIVIGILITLVFTPFLLNSLGAAQYGLFILVTTFISYLSILDMGMNDSVIRFLVKFRVSKEKNKEEYFLGDVIVFYLGLSFLILIIGIAIFINIELWFGNTFTEQEIITFKSMFKLIIGSVIIIIAFNPICATLVASEKFIFIKSAEISTHLISTLLMFILLANGYKVYAMALIMIITSLLLVLLKVIYAFYFLKIRVVFNRGTLATIKPLLKYALPIFVVVLTNQIYWKLDNIILASMLGPSFMTIYAIGLMFHKYFMSFSSAISKVMLPKVIRDIDNNVSAIQLMNLLIKVSRIQAYIVLLILCGLILFGMEFIELWIGNKYSDSYYVMILVMVPSSLSLMGNLRNTILQVKELYWYRAIIILIISLLNIILTVYWINIYGVIGAAASTGLSVLIGYCAINFLMSWKVGINTNAYIKGLFKGIGKTVIYSLLIGYPINNIPVFGWSGLIIKVTLFSFIYFVFCWFIAMNQEEKKLITNLFSSNKLFNKSKKNQI